ncbi:MAG: hypothetical protein IGQ45_04855 [Cyanobacterium sp. T60_A2020_053]|nr:hypothetical protein [Cyanobacterium sp. T60_A2020_053]
MSEKNSFGNGFLFGTVIGGLIGGVIGVIVTKKTTELNEDREEKKQANNYTVNNNNIENSRLSLEEKINQLNHAIDDVRVTLQKNTDLIDN